MYNYPIAIDFETYASTDLLKHGLDRYVNCPDFQPLIAAVYGPNPDQVRMFDFVTNDYQEEVDRLIHVLDLADAIIAHNAGFELAVLKTIAPERTQFASKFLDSAVHARAAGAAGKLEAAAPQLLGVDKMEAGTHLIKLFSIPGELQEESGSRMFDPRIIEQHPAEWAEFKDYCELDARLSFQIAMDYPLSLDEKKNNVVTLEMNSTGWHVDLDLVREMQHRYLHNVNYEIERFRISTGAADLNLSSIPQLKKWCAKRGVKASSFDEASVIKMQASLRKRLTSNTSLPVDQVKAYNEVLELLKVKQIIGGSSLKKLQTILDQVGEDRRLRDQYLHCGAGATFRTSGRGVQMQNLKRLHDGGNNVDELFLPNVHWSNQKLAENLRQVFTASHPNGKLIVGDFSSVESRGLAWLSGENWKLDAYRNGLDLYKVQAGLIFNAPYENITKPQRQIGKVGELSCGYGAGSEAVRTFAEKMGVELSEGEALQLVRDWRDANPSIVKFWSDLDDALHTAVVLNQPAQLKLQHGSITIAPTHTPSSLKSCAPMPVTSVSMTLQLDFKPPMLQRVIHGCYVSGRNIQYWKPSERKTGDLWVDRFTDPKTKRQKKYSVYGGKLAGLLTQSLCREIFFNSLRETHKWTHHASNVKLVGQFHDEIVLDWTPPQLAENSDSIAMPSPGLTLEETEMTLNLFMTQTSLPDFPLEADIKNDYRYTK